MCVCVFRDGGRGEGAGAWEGKVNSSHSLQSFLLRTSSSPFPRGPSLLLHPPQPIQALVPILDPRAKGKREGQQYIIVSIHSSPPAQKLGPEHRESSVR